MSGIVTTLAAASHLRRWPRYATYTPALERHGDRVVVRLLAPPTAYRKPKAPPRRGPAHDLGHVLQGDCGKAPRHRNNERWPSRYKQRDHDLDDHRRPRRVPRDEHEHIREELWHRAELDDLDAIATDGYGAEASTTPPITWTSPAEAPPRHEAPRRPTMVNAPARKVTGREPGVITTRSGSSRKRGFPARLAAAPDGELRTGSELLARLWGTTPAQTLAPDPEARATEWSLDDLIDDRREYREVGA